MKKNLVLKNNKSIKEPLKRNRWIWPISVLLSNRLFANDLSFLILAFFYTIFLASQNAAPVKQIEPIFHTVPPRPMRLLHSETYIRYIHIYRKILHVFHLAEKKVFILVPFSILYWQFFLLFYRYIEGLTTDSGVMSNWDRQLKASKEGIRAPGKLLKLWIIIFNGFLTAFISFFKLFRWSKITRSLVG